MRDATTEGLEPADADLWLTVQRDFERGDRRAALNAAERFAARVSHYPAERADRWVEALARNVHDLDSGERIPSPVFVSVVLPALVRGLDAGSPRRMRWLAQFVNEVHRAPRPAVAAVLGDRDARPAALLSEALRRDPTDDRVRLALLEELARGFAYAFHEVPSGVLDDPAVLAEELEDFERLAAEAGRSDEYRERVELWRFHARHYARYLASGPPYGGYPAYLARLAEAGEREPD